MQGGRGGMAIGKGELLKQGEHLDPKRCKYLKGQAKKKINNSNNDNKIICFIGKRKQEEEVGSMTGPRRDSPVNALP